MVIDWVRSGIKGSGSNYFSVLIAGALVLVLTLFAQADSLQLLLTLFVSMGVVFSRPQNWSFAHVVIELEVRYSHNMAPTIVRDGQFRLFFFSREEPRLHVHVSHPDGEAKFWLTPEVTLANYTGLSATQLRQANAVVNEHIKEIENAWNQHFGG